MRILIVDENEYEARQLVNALAECGYDEEVRVRTDVREVEAELHRMPVDVALLEAELTHGSGEALLTRLTELAPQALGVVVTGSTEVETAVRCMHAGAVDYVRKPVEPERVRSALRRVRAVHAHRGTEPGEAARAQAVPAQWEAVSLLRTRDPRMLEALAHAEGMAASSQPVLLEGETGTGKDLVARGLHALSGRPGPFVPISLGGLRPEEAAEVLFGMHDSRASASTETLPLGGACANAAQGTLFIDEIVELDVALQGPLLEVVLAAERLAEPPVRVIVATAHDLAAARDAARLRPDLYYHLQSCQVSLPPLRERPADIPLLLEHFLQEAAREFGKEPPTPPEELVALLAAYHFPGNVRELRSMVHDAVAKHRNRKLSMATFKQHIDRNRTLDAELPPPSQGRPEELTPTPRINAAPGRIPFPPRLPTLKEATNQLIDEAMRRASGKQSIAARMLGISQSALSRRLKNRANGE